MKRAAALLLAVAFTACQDPTTPAGPIDAEVQAPVTAQASADRVMPGRVLVKLGPGVRAEDVIRPHGLAVAGRGHRDAFLILQGAAAGNERAVAARLTADPRVVYAEPDYLRQTTAIDPRLWAFYNPGGLTVTFTSGRNKGKPVTSFASVADADEDNIQGYASGGSAVVIGSIDTGVDFGHSEFSGGVLIAGQDWYSGDGNPADENGHGTHTTGTMAGHTVGVAGVAGAGANVRVYVQRVCGPLGCPSSAIANAINAAADYPGMVAMNLSLGGGSESQAEKDAIAYAVNTRGVLVIASAGNDGTGTVSCPACDPLAISVGATNWQDALTYYTNWGPGLDITAPGGQLYSNTTEEGGIYSAYTGGGYRYLQGTSMAAPQVTGTAGIVASKAGLRGADLRTRLLGSADDKGAGGYDQQFGNGRLNSYRAVTNSALNEGGSGGAPSASFTYSCANSATCSFTASSSGLDGPAYGWTFGDGDSAIGSPVSHTFAAGSWLVTLTATGTNGSATSQRTVKCAVKGRTLRCS
ncbi:MAG TPA: S8 family serine peptidase [Gemmatimonadales bacterium]|nr:S8 family serine peptidase [Gemmatimonadales bacterium]